GVVRLIPDLIRVHTGRRIAECYERSEVGIVSRVRGAIADIPGTSRSVLVRVGRGPARHAVLWTSENLNPGLPSLRYGVVILIKRSLRIFPLLTLDRIPGDVCSSP